jgi:hypothetical protein
VRETVRVALTSIATRFSNDAPSVDPHVLRRRYGDTSVWPVDAELGLLVLAWTLGPGFAIRGFREALAELIPDFARAARAVGQSPSNPTLVTIGGIARCCLSNGAMVVKWDLDPEVLYWPLDLSKCKGV